MAVMTHAAGRGTTFVQSRRPPMPVSSSTTSDGVCAKARNARAVVASKKVNAAPAFAAMTRSKRVNIVSSCIVLFFNTIRSLKRTRCGEV